MKKLLILISSMLFCLYANAGQDQKDYIIKYKPGFKSALIQSVRSQSAQVRLEVDEAGVISVPLNENQYRALQNHPHIEYIEEDVQAELLSQITPYAVNLIQADQLSDNQASNMKVCIIDTGLQIAHEDINPMNLSGSSPDGSGLIWSEPDHSHGTYMAGAVIAENNGIGVSGVLPNGYISLHAFRIDSNYIPSSDVVAGLYDCQANGANIISVSLALSRSRTVQNAVRDLTREGLLIFASSGNDGDTTKRYPASYSEVIAIGAVNRFEQRALYSNYGTHLDFVMPGDAVLGTELIGNGKQATLNIAGDSTYESVVLHNSPFSQVTGLLVDCGDMSVSCPQAMGNICLIQTVRTQQQNNSDGSFNVNDQVAECEAQGGVGAILFGDATEVQYAGMISPDLAMVNIPAATISDSEMNLAFPHVGEMTTLNVESGNYIRAFGTSISSPYASAAAALVWSHHPNCSAQDIREALTITAKDLGDSGRDDYYGNGLMQTLDAKLFLDSNPCGGSTNIPPTASFSYQCNLLSCSFDASASSDSDGSIIGHSWDFGDNNSSAGVNVTHNFATEGTYTVQLSVTDDTGTSSQTTQQVNVSTSAIQLSLNGYKIKGKGYTDLFWSGANGTNIKIFRNGIETQSVTNNGFFTDFVGQRGSFEYQICETDGVNCSSVQTVNF